MVTPVHAGPDGDDTSIDVRLVVAPVAGVFRPAPVAEITTEGELVAAGGTIGHIVVPGRNEPVTSFCAGFLVRLLAEPGERVRPGRPLAWLHPTDRPATRPGAAA
jgi:multidrug efflux pump subunit AcrA (membrane-fusion protein)